MSRILAPLVRLPWRSIPLRPFLARRSYSTPYRELVPESKADHRVVNEATANNVTVDYAQKYLRKPAPEGVRLAKDRLEVTVDGHKRGFRYMLLRDACKCDLCVDEHSKQRNFRTTDIPHRIVPREVTWDGKKLQIQWAFDVKGWSMHHVSTYDAHTLRENRANPPRSATGRYRPRFLWNKFIMEAKQHWVSYDEYMNDEKAFAKAMRYLSLMGIIFVKDIPDSREMVEKIATRLGPLRNTFYGPTWDVRSVPQAKNVAYTNVFLGFHMDLMYMNEPPGFQLLHCLQNSCDGGESLFVDSFRAVSEIRDRWPESFKKLTELRLNYEYNHKDHVYYNSWPVVEMEDGDPTRRVGHVNYSPPFQAPIISNEPMYGKWRGYMRALTMFTNEIERERNVFQRKLNPGECVIFENRRILHARNKFNTEQGQRWLAGAYVDEDAVLSTFRTCRDADPEGWIGTLVKTPTIRGSNLVSETSADAGGQATAENKEIA
ncbi:putative Gamma-butyrobetaine hydroxylase subfamily [Aspergillus thermomutatus]|uniref:TauD/TfdA-like domain-containing protein n=1 Tax=Aspergillus thermomutatus TaxID=41047 RepID=A0A397HBL1_ASPTH|nr:uncharacterized protein CDV56_104689 [Aspergillus thermomutatus]RHZ60442.1 hypothetical protein CDV56_104689 [Aspergillus thermomutatus]